MKKDIYFSEYAKPLTGNYKKAYDQIVFYVDVMNPANSSLPEIMNDVIDLLLSAQEDGKDVENVIGKDRLHFCKELVRSHQKSPFHRVLVFMSGYRIFAGIGFFLGIFSLLIDFSDGLKDPWMADVKIGGFLLMILFSFILFEVFSLVRKWLVSHTTWYSKSMDQIALVALFVIVIFAAFTFPEELDHVIVFPKWLFLIFSLVIFLICTWYKKQEKKRDIQNGNYISYDNIAYNTNLEVLQKKYRKYEKKCQTKQTPVLDSKQWYSEYYRKDMRNESFSKAFAIVIFLVFGTIGFLHSSFIDACLYILILGVFAYFFYRFLNKSTLAKRAIYRDIQERHTDILDSTLKKEDVPF